jgi:AcrR family transcriptional regulator
MRGPLHASRSASVRSHTPKGARAKGRIVRVAEELFAERGFHGTSMRDVAALAGLPLATVVYHFAKKEQLYAAVLRDIGGELAEDLERVLTDASASWATRLDAVTRALVAWTEKHPKRVKLLLRELLDNPTRVARAARLPLAPVLLGLSEFVASGMRAGAFRHVVAETSVLHLVGAVSYFVASRPTVRRIVGPTRDRQLATSWAHEATALARRMFLVSQQVEDGSNEVAGTRSMPHRPSRPRARARHRAHDRR